VELTWRCEAPHGRANSIDFEAAFGLDRHEVLELFGCGFVEDHTNVVFQGGAGADKTHLAIALVLACCQAEYRVQFTTAAELTTMLVDVRAEDRLSRKLAQVAASTSSSWTRSDTCPSRSWTPTCCSASS
jgi:DNA replication protein DnaC